MFSFIEKKMLLKIALLLSMLIQLGATVIAISLIHRTKYNVSWILISAGMALMAVRRLFDFSLLFWDAQLFAKDEFNSWLGVLISILMFIGVIFIRQIFNFQKRIDQIREESELRVLSAVIHTEEKARQHLARDLHDGLGPVLSSIKMILSAIDQEKLDQTNRKIIERSCQSADEAILSLKEISNHLSPHLLDNYGLIKAIRSIANQFLEASKIQFHMNSNIGDQRYSRKLEINLYRIICELLNNSVNHASPGLIRLDIIETQRSIQLTYQDDGCGFSFDGDIETNKLPGMGMENIFSRTKLLKGKYHLETAPSKGFTIHLNIPVV